MSILSIYDFCLICYKRNCYVLTIKLEKKYSPFKIVYSLTILNLTSLLVDEKVRLDGNRKT